MKKFLCTWLGEFCYSCSLTVLPGPAWVVHIYVFQRIFYTSVEKENMSYNRLSFQHKVSPCDIYGILWCVMPMAAGGVLSIAAECRTLLTVVLCGALLMDLEQHIWGSAHSRRLSRSSDRTRRRGVRNTRAICMQIIMQPTQLWIQDGRYSPLLCFRAI